MSLSSATFVSFHSMKEGAGVQWAGAAHQACGSSALSLSSRRRGAHSPGEAAGQAPTQKPRNCDQRESQESDSRYFGEGISGIFPAIPPPPPGQVGKRPAGGQVAQQHSPRSLLFIIALDARIRGPCWVKW